MNIHQARKLAVSSGWEVHSHPGSHWYWSYSFHKPDQAAIWVRFSPNGRLTKVEATDFITGVRQAPTRDKATRLSHYLTEGIV
jgi:hypothetical protein